MSTQLHPVQSTDCLIVPFEPCMAAEMVADRLCGRNTVLHTLAAVCIAWDCSDPVSTVSKAQTVCKLLFKPCVAAEMVADRLGGRNTTLQTVAAEPCAQHARVVAIGALRAGVGRCKSESLPVASIRSVAAEPDMQHACVVAIRVCDHEPGPARWRGQPCAQSMRPKSVNLCVRSCSAFAHLDHKPWTLSASAGCMLTTSPPPP